MRLAIENDKFRGHLSAACGKTPSESAHPRFEIITLKSLEFPKKSTTDGHYLVSILPKKPKIGFVRIGGHGAARICVYRTAGADCVINDCLSYRNACLSLRASAHIGVAIRSPTSRKIRERNGGRAMLAPTSGLPPVQIGIYRREWRLRSVEWR